MDTRMIADRMRRNQAYENSIFGRVSDWLGRQQEGLEGASSFNPISMALEGAQAANRWMGAPQFPERVQQGDMLAPFGMAAMGAPFAVRGAVGSAGGRIGRSARIHAMNEIGSFEDLRRQLAEKAGDERFFVRWSRGPQYDMRPGAASKDYQTGQRHAGLSAVPIDAGMTDQELFSLLRDYGYLRSSKNPAKPHIYSGVVVGRDSDNADAIRPSRFIGTLADKFVAMLDDELALERIKLRDAIKMYRGILAGDRAGVAPQFYERVEADLTAAEKRLSEIDSR